MIEVKYRATLETTPLEYNYSGDVGDQAAEEQKEQVGKYPLIYIDGTQIENQNIKYLKLFNNKMFPTIEMEFSDPTSHLMMDHYPVDNTIVSLYKRSTSSGLMDIKMDFKITKFKMNNGVSGGQVSLKLTGVLNIDKLYLFNFESYEDSTYNIIDKLSKDMELGLVSNISSTNDAMKWINPGDYRKNFITELIQNSYIDDTTFLFGYIDFYYNFNYIDINKQLSSNISEQNNIDDNERIGDELPNDPVALILSNNEDIVKTNMYISKYTIDNDSTLINLDGYRYRYTDYDKSEDKVNSYFIESMSSSDNNSIVLMGNPFTKNNLLYDESIQGVWVGKKDTYNVYENYLHAGLQNENNLKFLQKLKMTIQMGKPNYALYRFQKILIELYNFGKIEDEEEMDSQQDGTGQNQYDSKIIHRLSGEWLITAINLTFSRESGNIQEITLVKRELTEEYNFPRREN